MLHKKRCIFFLCLIAFSTLFAEGPRRKKLELPGADSPLTKKYRDNYLTDAGRKWLREVLYNSAPYRPYIRAQLKKRRLPMILQYLPIVESDYKVHAVSKSGAAGMWQFMENSMSPYLKKNYWYDERFDPWKETDAALSKLADNYKMFGDWSFALAAYNMGAGAISRTIKEHPGKTYWNLAENGDIRSQTAMYVPKLLAVADIIENAEYYGLIDIGAIDKMIEGKAPEQYSYLRITGKISLSEIAAATGIDLETLIFLNPALLHECTPSKETYRLRLPYGSAKKAAEDLKMR